MKRYLLRFTRRITIIFFVLLSTAAFTQDGPPDPPIDPGGGGTGDIPIGGSPIDGGTSFLLILGAAFGKYKCRNQQ